MCWNFDFSHKDAPGLSNCCVAFSLKLLAIILLKEIPLDSLQIAFVEGISGESTYIMVSSTQEACL